MPDKFVPYSDWVCLDCGCSEAEHRSYCLNCGSNYYSQEPSFKAIKQFGWRMVHNKNRKTKLMKRGEDVQWNNEFNCWLWRADKFIT